MRAACADLPTLLVDHAHCEKRAASTAVRYLFKYPDWPALVGAMSRLAREELVHFERVLKELEARGVAFRGLPSANYAAALFEQVRSDDARARKVDELLCCALIEARSHERFVRLAAAVGGRAAGEVLRRAGRGRGAARRGLRRAGRGGRRR